MLGRELFTPDEVRKLDNKKCIVFIRGFDPVVDYKYVPFKHPMFSQTEDGGALPFEGTVKAHITKSGAPYIFLSPKALKYYENLKEKGENVYIDSLKYEEFMLLGKEELNKRFIAIDESEQKHKFNESNGSELEYTDEGSYIDEAFNADEYLKSKRKQAEKNEDWEDTISNRLIYWIYSDEQKAALRKATGAGMPKAKILEFFRPENSVEKMEEEIEKFISENKKKGGD